jgi:hypothetical protein
MLHPLNARMSRVRRQSTNSKELSFRFRPVYLPIIQQGCQLSQFQIVLHAPAVPQVSTILRKPENSLSSIGSMRCQFGQRRTLYMHVNGCRGSRAAPVNKRKWNTFTQYSMCKFLLLTRMLYRDTDKRKSSRECICFTADLVTVNK